MIPNQYLLNLVECNGTIDIKLMAKESSISSEHLTQAYNTLQQLRGKDKETILGTFPEASEELITKLSKPVIHNIPPLNEMKDFKYEFVSITFTQLTHWGKMKERAASGSNLLQVRVPSHSV